MNRNYTAIRTVLIITFALNVVAMGIKLGVGLWTGALSLVADGLDTLFDGLSNVVGLVAVRISRQPPDEDHPYGHRKFETIAALFIATALFVTAWELATGALDRLLNPKTPIVNAWTMAALLVGAGIQGAAGWWEMRRARQLESELLLADARHTLASIGVSATVLVGLGLVQLGNAWVDPAVAMLIAGLIAKIGVDTVNENIPALVDRAPLNAEQIGGVVASVQGVQSFHRIRSRGPADSVAIDLHIRVDSNLPMQEANAIADEVRRRLLAWPGVADVTVHVEAERGPDSSMDLSTAVKLAGHELGLTLHECWVQETDHQLSLHLHVGVDPNLTLAEAHARVDQLEQTILERQPQVASVHSHIELASPEILPSARVSRGLSERIVHVIQEVAEGIPQLSDPHDIHVRQVEGRLFITVEVLVDGALSVGEAHDLSTLLQDTVRARLANAGEVLVHLEPK